MALVGVVFVVAVAVLVVRVVHCWTSNVVVEEVGSRKMRKRPLLV